MKLIKLLIIVSVVNMLIVFLLVLTYSKVVKTNLHLPNPVQVVASPEPKTINTPLPSATHTATKPVLTKPATTKLATTKPETPKPTAKAAPVVVNTPKPAAGCVIMIDGAKYEITSLQRTHSGGNVFTCGSDMSAIFWGRHNQKILQIMQQYRI